MTTKNIILQDYKITKKDRQQLNGHKPLIAWFTGLSGSGKSTLAGVVEEHLFEMGVRTYLLDGDNIRHGLNSNVDFSDEGRKENIRRIGEVAKLFTDAGIVVLTAFISPANRISFRLNFLSILSLRKTIVERSRIYILKTGAEKCVLCVCRNNMCRIS